MYKLTKISCQGFLLIPKSDERTNFFCLLPPPLQCHAVNVLLFSFWFVTIEHVQLPFVLFYIPSSWWIQQVLKTEEWEARGCPRSFRLYLQEGSFIFFSFSHVTNGDPRRRRNERWTIQLIGSVFRSWWGEQIRFCSPLWRRRSE